LPSLTLPRRRARSLEVRLGGKAPARLLAAAVLLGSCGVGLAYSKHPGKVLDVVGRVGGFEVRTVQLDGQLETSGSAIIAAIGLGPGLSLLSLDVEEVRARLESLPWVKAATVRKVLPATLDIAIEEAEAFARWRRDEAEVLVAMDGSVLSDSVPFRFRRLPLVAGRGANEAVVEARDLLAAHPGVAERTAAALRVNERRWDLLLESGAVVRLPEEGALAALDRLAALERDVAVLASRPAVIDLRLPDRTTVELSPDEGVEVAARQTPARTIPLPDDDPVARAIAEAGL